MVTFGKGGWDWETVYNLPVPLRNLYMKYLSEVVEKEADAYKPKSSSKGPLKPNIQRKK